jgi:hypothetical protein
MNWRFSDLVTDHKSGLLRETSVWSNIGKAAMTVAFLYVVYKGDSSQWLWLAYGGVVVAHESVSRILNQKQQTLDKVSP